MAGVFAFNQHEVLAFFLVLMRMSAFVVTWPIFGTPLLPAPMKVLFAVALSIVVFPVLNWTGIEASLDSLQLIPLVIKEIFIGLCIGFLARMFLHAMSISGEIISVSMGLSSTQLFNPSTGENSTTINQFQVMLVSLLFLALNGHHYFLSALVSSFDLVPLATTGVSLAVFGTLGDVIHTIMVIGVKISAPIMISVMIMNVVMGIVGRAVPQINVLITALPLNILVGFMIMIVTLPVVFGQVEGLIDFSAQTVFRFLKGF